jgi:hypothetical protein
VQERFAERNATIDVYAAWGLSRREMWHYICDCLSDYLAAKHTRYPRRGFDASNQGGQPMFASWGWVPAVWRTLGSNTNRQERLRRRSKPEVAPLEERIALSTAAGNPAVVASAVHASVLVRSGHRHHGTRVSFPGGSVVSNPGGQTMVKFPGGLVSSVPGSTVVNFPGGFVNSGAGGTVIRFPGGSVVIG